MEIKDLFDEQGLESGIARINNLNAESTPQWGKMNVSQMLAHLSVAYEMFYHKENYKAAGPVGKFMLKIFVKNIVVGPKPYKKNNRTAPEFIIDDERDFEAEKTKLIGFMRRTQELGRSHFEGAESLSFGPLSADEWNMLYSKHLDHHMTQFGV